MAERHDADDGQDAAALWDQIVEAIGEPSTELAVSELWEAFWSFAPIIITQRDALAATPEGIAVGARALVATIPPVTSSPTPRALTKALERAGLAGDAAGAHLRVMAEALADAQGLTEDLAAELNGGGAA